MAWRHYTADGRDVSEGESVAAEALLEGVDYYVEAGMWVFTAHYLRKRGYCCESGCRHCPYGFVKAGGIEQKKVGEQNESDQG